MLKNFVFDIDDALFELAFSPSDQFLFCHFAAYPSPPLLP